MTLAELSKAAKALIRDARSGTLERNAFSNGSFTVTNLGALGIESFTPINNPPQTGILGVCAAVNRLAADGSVYPAIGLSLTFDHRALDGAPAASFLNDLSIYLANFDLKLAG